VVVATLDQISTPPPVLVIWTTWSGGSALPCVAASVAVVTETCIAGFGAGATVRVTVTVCGLCSASGSDSVIVAV